MALEVAVELTHAEVQAIAEDHGIDLLHIKGPALDASLRRAWPDAQADATRKSMDADVLIRPTHVERFAAALREHGWRRLYNFADGSAFEHAATWFRSDLASLDVHRYFPGMEGDADAAFDLLWTTRQAMTIAGIECPVPNLDAQRLIVLIHAARGRSDRDLADRARAWETVGDGERDRIELLAERLQATVALRAGTGRLETVRGARTYPLWWQLTKGDSSPPALWWARVRSAPTWRSGARLGVRMILPNARRIEARLGRPPTRSELRAAYKHRLLYAYRILRMSSAKRLKRR